jgi:Lrp/AsnC family transcriptional regulator, leucine-responsive regulatory protein
MDEIDSAILGILAVKARISYSDLGREVGLSPNAAAARIRRLEATGTILGYRAVLADEEPVLGLEAFVDVRLEPAADSEQFLTWTRGVPGIVEAIHVTGAYDYLLRVRAADTSALDTLLRTIRRSGGATQTQTRLALGRAVPTWGR